MALAGPYVTILLVTYNRRAKHLAIDELIEIKITLPPHTHFRFSTLDLLIDPSLVLDDMTVQFRRHGSQQHCGRVGGSSARLVAFERKGQRGLWSMCWTDGEGEYSVNLSHSHTCNRLSNLTFEKLEKHYHQEHPSVMTEAHLISSRYALHIHPQHTTHIIVCGVTTHFTCNWELEDKGGYLGQEMCALETRPRLVSAWSQTFLVRQYLHMWHVCLHSHGLVQKICCRF